MNLISVAPMMQFSVTGHVHINKWSKMETKIEIRSDKYTLFYKKPVYKKLGLDLLKF